MLVCSSLEELVRPMQWCTLLIVGPDGLYADEDTASSIAPLASSEEEERHRKSISKPVRIQSILEGMSKLAELRKMCDLKEKEIELAKNTLKMQLELRAALIKKVHEQVVTL